MKFRKFLPFLILIFLGSIPLLDLLNPGLPATHDGQDHVARIANFYKNLEEGNIIPRWAGNLNWGFGHPILMFLYPLPSYFASFFHFLGFSLVDSLKLVFASTFILSGIFMYLWLRSFLTREGSLIGGALYMLAPYRFVDIYVRGAFGEHVAFVFPPLILYSLYKLSKKYSYPYFVLASVSVAGLLLSHNAVSVMFLPIIILYGFYLLWLAKFNKRLIFRFILALVLGIGVSSFFLLPAFYEGKYTLRDIVTSEDYKTRFVELKDLAYGVWNYGISGQFSVQIGIVHLILTILAIPLTINLFIKKNKIWIFTFGVLLTLLISIFLMHQSSVFIWDKISILQKFQFPWRFLSVVVFATSVLGAIVVDRFPDTYKRTLVLIAVIALLFINKDYWQAREYVVKEESFFSGIYNSTTDTGESSPIWSVRFMEQRPKAHIEIVEGRAEISEISRRSTEHKYKAISEDWSIIKENTLYFPGWVVRVNGEEKDIEFQNPNHRGLITFSIPKGEHDIQLKFEETKLRTFSNLITVFSMLVLAGMFASKRKI